MAKIAFFEIEDWEKNYIKEKLSLPNSELVFFKDELDLKKTNKVTDVEILCIFIYSRITKEILDKLPQLKFITTCSTGFDHIDLKECQRRNILVSNVSAYGENTVAEHTLALILSLSRKIPASIERTRRGNFTLIGLMGFDLIGKTIGIVGTGDIGKHVCRIVCGFDMNILAYDIKKDKNLIKKYRVKYVDFETLLKKSDIITLHVPLNKHTHHMINRKNLSLIKKGALFINTSRGGVVETTAILEGLGKGIFSGVALDTLEEEDFIKEERELLSSKFPKKFDLRTVLQNHVLLDQENVIITPHSAFYSKEAIEKILDTTVLNIKSFTLGRPKNLVK